MGNVSSVPLPTPAAWSSSPLDTCLDQLGTAEAVVRDQEVEIEVLKATLRALKNPWLVAGLALGLAVLCVFELFRLAWYLCTGPVEHSFPLDRFPGWLLRRIWRVLRFPFVLVAERVFGRCAAEEVRDRLDQLAVSPVQQGQQQHDRPPPYSIHEDPRRAVPPLPHLHSASGCGGQRSGGCGCGQQQFHQRPASASSTLCHHRLPYGQGGAA
jgi:hypothetical protein